MSDAVSRHHQLQMLHHLVNVVHFVMRNKASVECFRRHEV